MLKMFSVAYNLFMFNNFKINSGNQIQNSGAFLKKSKIIVKGKNNLIILEPGVRLNNCTINMSGNNAVLHIKRETYADKQIFHFEDNGCQILVGEKCILNGGQMSAAEDERKIIVGSKCLFSSNIHIVTTDSHSILDLKSKKRINKGEDVVVGERVWITAGVSLLKGSAIAAGSVVGHKSVVTKKFVQENCVIAGNPAKIVKENIQWLAERI